MTQLLLFCFFFFSNALAQISFAPRQNYQIERPRALFVFLHGCKMDGQQFARTTAIENFIEKEKIVAIFPSQNKNYNSDNCWNWFLPSNQNRFLSLEHFSILDQIEKAQSFYNIPSDKTFLVGLSSGAAYAINLASCFPEKFNGIALHSGLSYLAATDVLYANQALINGPQFKSSFTAEQAFLCGGKNHHLMKTLLIHGKEDKRVYPINFESMKEHFLYLYDLIDDGKLNQTFPALSTQFPIKSPNKYTYSEENFMTKFHEVILKSLFIEQLEHKWSGGAKNEPYADVNGPDATKLILDYFLTVPSKHHQE
jgi:poly(hydroxyalkanoate) depolymerase family esterase